MRAMRHVGAAIVTLAGTTAVLCGVPLLLIRAVGNPIPSNISSLDEAIDAVGRGGDAFGDLLLGLLAVFVWALWLQLVAALVVEVAATLRGRPTPRLPTLPGVQPFAARIVASFTLALSLATGPVLSPALGALDLGPLALTSGTSTAVAAPSPVVPAMAHAADLHPASNGVGWGARSGDARSSGHVAHGDDDAAPQGMLDEPLELRVYERTELWDLASAAYGDGARWKVIAAANVGRADGEGRELAPGTEVVVPGTVLVLPDASDPLAIEAFGSVIPRPELAGAAHVHVVRPGDSMWSIAERHVAESTPTSTTELDAAAVAAHWTDVVAANAGVRSGDIDIIYPGDRLLIPEIAATEGADRAPEPTEPLLGDAPDAAGPAGWPHAGEVAPAAPAEVDVVVPDPSDDASPAPPSNGSEAPLESPSESAGTSPARPADDDSTGTSPVADSDGPDGAPDPTGEQAVGSADVDPAPSASWSIAMAGAGGLLLAGALAAALRRRRTLQWRVRAPGHMPPDVSPDASALGATLAHLEAQHDDERPWKIVPLESLSESHRAAAVPIEVDESGRIVVGSSDSDGTPTGSRAIDEITIVDPAAGAGFDLDRPWPVSLLIGTDPDDDQAVFVDLVPGARIALDGDRSALLRFVRSATADLAVSDRGGDVRVIAVGVASGLADLDRVTSVDSWEDAVLAAVAAGSGGDTVTSIETHDSTDPLLTPVIVLGADTPTPEITGALGASVVIAPGVATATVLRFAGSDVTVEPAGVTAAATWLTEAEYASVTELVHATAVDALEPAEPTDSFFGPTTAAVSASERDDARSDAAHPLDDGSPEPELEVRVLGPVDVAGASPFSSVKAVDVIAYLAFHRQGVDADQLKAWVWPAFEPPTDKAFANVVSRARVGLGVDASGTPLLSRAGSDRLYRLDPAVGTDFDRFRSLVAEADHPDLADRPAEQLDRLRQAIALVRGAPFTGGTATSFAWADHAVRSHVEFTLDEAIHRCVDLALDLGDLTAARVAVLKGLELVPGCEQCFRRRFLVARAGNNRQELRRAMADLERTAAAELGEPEAVDLISRDLLVLFEQLDQELVAGSP